MLGMETIRKIRLALRQGMGIREAARKFNKCRKTIRKIARSGATSFSYQRREQRYPALGGYIGALESLLEANALLCPKKRRTLISLYEELQGQGYQGSYSAIRRPPGYLAVKMRFCLVNMRCGCKATVTCYVV